MQMIYNNIVLHHPIYNKRKKTMLKNKNFAIIFWGVSILFALIATFLRTHSMASYYDGAAGYFASESILPYVITAVIAAMVLILATIMFIIPKNEVAISLTASPLMAFASALTCFVFALIFIFSVFSLNSESSALGLGMTALALLSAIYFAFDLLTRKKDSQKLSDLKAVLGLAPAFWFLLLMLSVYFDRSLPTNSPIKNFVYITLIAAILSVIYECHLYLGYRQSHIYLGISYIATMLCFSLSISHIVCANLSASSYMLSPMYDYAVLAMGIYTAVRSFELSLAISKGNEEK